MKLRFGYEMGLRLVKTVLAALLLASAVVGAYISATDAYLWTEAPSHAYGLIAFVIVDVIAVGVLYARPRWGRMLALAMPAVEFVAMVGDLYMGLGSPGSEVQASFREYLLNDSAFMVLLVIQAVLVGLALGYLVQPPVGLPERQEGVSDPRRRALGT